MAFHIEEDACFKGHGGPCPPVRNSTKQYSKLRQREALVFVLQLEKVKILSVKLKKWLQFWGVLYMQGEKKGKKNNKKKKEYSHQIEM